MDKKKVGRAVVGGMVVCFLTIGESETQANRVEIWSDDFEATDNQFGPEWTVAGGGISIVGPSSLAFEGSRYLNFVGPNGSGVEGDTVSTLALEVSTAGYENLVFEGSVRVHSGLETADSITVAASPNGLDWTILDTFTDLLVSDWGTFSYPLSGLENNPAVSIRLASELGSASDRLLVDAVSVQGNLIPEPATLLIFVPALGIAFKRQRHRRFLRYRQSRTIN